MLTPTLNTARSCTRRSLALAFSRQLSSTSARYLEADTGAGSMSERKDPSFSSIEAKSFKQFLNSPAVQAVRDSKQPRNWMGRDRPFPMNKTFLPPSPIPDEVRQMIYDEYMRDPVNNTLRILSERFHISLKRVDAILRLKGHEVAWAKKGNTLQTGFLEGMEHLLGVKEDQKYRKQLAEFNAKQAEAAEDVTRRDVHEADTLEEDERRDSLRQRYQRMYWETVSESGGEPIAPGSIEQAIHRAQAKDRKAAAFMNVDPKLMPKIKYTPGIKQNTPVIQQAKKPGRPNIVFVDVGAKFVDIDERVQRIKNSKRRLNKKQNIVTSARLREEKQEQSYAS